MLRVFAVFALLVLLVITRIAPVAAHEGRVVGEYEISFGWYVEPAYAGQLNGPDLYITLHGEGDHERRAAGANLLDDAPTQDTLEALVVDLQAEVMFGGESVTIMLVPDSPTYVEFDGVGYLRYTSTLIPTLPGDYSFRIFGTIEDTEIDEQFNAADGEFSTVEPAQDILFPSSQSLEARIAALEARLTALEAAGG